MFLCFVELQYLKISWQSYYLCNPPKNNRNFDQTLYLIWGWGPILFLPFLLLYPYPFFCKVFVTTELILQAFSHFTYVTAHSDSPSFPSLHLHHSSFSNHSLALPTSQLVLQIFRCFTYVTAHSPTLLSPLLRHRIFTYVTWRAAHALLMLYIAYLLRLKEGKNSERGERCFTWK